MQYSSKKRKWKIFWEVVFWLLVLLFLALSITKIVLNGMGDEHSVILKVINALQTIILAIQMPLMLLKLRSTTFYFIERNRLRKELLGKGVIVKKHKKIIDEVALAIKTKEASKSEVKRIRHNEQIAIALKANCGDLLRGTPYYMIKDLMNDNGDRKERLEKIVDILRDNNITLTKNIKILLKNIA